MFVDVNEKGGLINSEKVGRVRICRVNVERLAAAESWLSEQRALWQARADRLAAMWKLRCRGAVMMRAEKSELTIARFIKAPPAIVCKA